MLILSRRLNESLRIAGNVVITVIGFSGNQIRLGITAPPQVTIDREEVHQRKMAERAATAPAPTTAQSTQTHSARPRPEVRARSRLPME